MSAFEDSLETHLEAISSGNLLRRLREVESPQGTNIQIDESQLINFSSNDYLGLANHSKLKEAAIEAIKHQGAGAGASRLICGSLKVFHELEEQLAAFKQAEACLTFSTGYAAAIGTITALVGKNDIVIIDKLVHACIVDAARMSGAKLRVFKHNDLNDLERILKWAGEKIRIPNSEKRNILIVTESVFSMDGDTAPLKEIVALKENYGAWLMVDEAHATGLFGGRRSGLVEHLSVSENVEIQMGTLGKAVGASGGFICGSRKLVDCLINSARSFIFSTAPVPAAAAAARAGVELIQSEEGRNRCQRVWENAEFAETNLSGVSNIQSPILPIAIGEEARAVEVADSLRQRGFFVPAIRYPTVARGTARLRMTLSADHTHEQINSLATNLQKIIDHTS